MHTLFRRKKIPHLFWRAGFFSLVLTIAACSNAGSTHPDPASTRQAAISPYLTSTVATGFKMYTGTHFRLNYPQSWQIQGSGNQMIFQDAQGLNTLTVIISPDPRGRQSVETLVNTVFPPVEKAVLTNPQAASEPSTVTVAGETRVQRSATATFEQINQTIFQPMLPVLSLFYYLYRNETLYNHALCIYCPEMLRLTTPKR